MSLFHQETDSLLGGVSQLDTRQRDPSQVEAGTNLLPDIVDGLKRRPPTEHKAILNASPTAYDPVYSTVVSKGLDDRYRVVITGSDLKVFNVSTDAELTVDFPHGKGYLTGSDFRVVSFGDRTFVLNQNTTVDKLVTNNPYANFNLTPETLIYVRQADYQTTYTINVEGYLAVYQTPAANSPEAREKLDTVEIARELHNALLTSSISYAYTGGSSSFTTFFESERIGSSIFVKRKLAAGGQMGPFEVRVNDGMADKGLLVIQDEVQLYEDLPLDARDGFVCKVVGDVTEDDDLWYVYDQSDGANIRGTWRETTKPGEPISLDASTMPHELIFEGPWTGDGTARNPPTSPVVINSRWDLTESDWVNRSDDDGTGSVTAGIDTQLYGHDAFVSATVPAAVEGVETDLEIALDVDTSTVDPSTFVRVVLEIDDGLGTYSTLDTLQIPSGENLRDLRVRATTTPATGATLRARLEYSDGASQTTAAKATVNMTGAYTPPVSDTDQGVIPRRDFSIRYVTKISKYLSFGVHRVFPKDFDITVTIDGVPFTHTPTVNETGTTVATAFYTAIDAHASFTATNPQDGIVEVLSGTGASEPTITFTMEFDDSTDVWFEDLDLTGLSLVGETVQNISDGSSGVITAHDNQSISVTSLTGGFDNTFQAGDIIRVSGTTSDVFVFKEAAWVDRKVGDLNSNPFPEFVGSTIDDLAFYQGRLGFVWQDKLHFSKSGKPTNLFRATAREFRADDGFGFQSAGGRMFHSAIEWDESLYVVSDTGISLVKGTPILTPTTVSMEQVARVENSSSVEPIVLENTLYLAREKPTGLQIFEIRRRQEDILQVADITLPVPQYLTGTPVSMVGSYSDGVILVVTSAGAWLYRFKDLGTERVLGAWGEWDVGSGTIKTADIVDGEIGLIIARPDAITLETITLDV